MTSAGIMALQHQLTDAGCYRGALDNKANTDLQKALAACPDPRPVLRIETGIHSAHAPSAAVDAQCRLAVTGATDKTVRLWSLPEGRLIRTQRLPIGLGVGGEIYAVAVSPDGTRVAAGGSDAAWDANGKHSIYLFDSADGQSIRRLGSYETSVSRLVFSPDGKRIAIQLRGAAGLRIIEFGSGAETTIRPNSSVRDFAFGSDSNLYVLDGYKDKGNMSNYSPLGGEILSTEIKFKNDDLTEVSIALSKDKIVYGNRQTGLFLASLKNLKINEELDISSFSGNSLSMTWSSNGEHLFVSGMDQDRKDNFIKVFSKKGKVFGKDVEIEGGDFVNMFSCPSKILLQAYDPRNFFGQIENNSTRIKLEIGISYPSWWWSSYKQNDYREFDFDADQMTDQSRRVLKNSTGGEVVNVIFNGQSVSFDIKKRVAMNEKFDDPNLRKAHIHYGLGVGLFTKDEDRKKAWEIYDKEEEILPDDYNDYLSHVIREDLKGSTLATTTSIIAVNDKKHTLWKLDSLPSRVRGLGIARGGDLILVAYSDGTVRWHRWSDGKELLALFVKDTRAWVAWTPMGYYTASPGGEDMIGWHVNRGWEQQADFFPASKFRDQYARPDIVERVLDTMDEAEAVRQANASAGKAGAKPIAESLPPVVTIRSSPAGGRFSGDSIDIAYELRSPSGLPVDDVIVRVDGIAVQTRGLGRADDLKATGRTVTVPLPRKSSVVTLTARSGAITSVAARLDLVYDGETPAPVRAKPTLYALVIGVSDYADPAMRLMYGAKDARDFAKGVKTLEGGLYGAVKVRLLLDRNATRDSMIEGLDWLNGEIVNRATPDVAMVYFAGHGETDRQSNFWLLPSDATSQNLRSRGVSRGELNQTLSQISDRGHTLLFLDACHSGNATIQVALRGRTDMNKVLNDFGDAKPGLTIFAASEGRELSAERADLNNGVWTKALIEGLFEGRAARDDNNAITPLKLQDYIATRVKALDGQQHPTWLPAAGKRDFPIALPRP